MCHFLAPAGQPEMMQQKLQTPAFAHFRGAVLMHEVFMSAAKPRGLRLLFTFTPLSACILTYSTEAVYNKPKTKKTASSSLSD
jgi:hypothetical protein